MIEILAEGANQISSIGGSIQGALGCMGAALGVALAEAVAFYSLFLGK